MKTIKAFIRYTLTGERLSIELKGNQCVKEVVKFVEDYFKLGASYGGTEERVLVLQYGGADLHGDWLFDDLNIMPGSTIKCTLKEEKIPDYYIEIPFLGETYKFYDDNFDISTFRVVDLRIKMSEIYGFPLSIFRLKPKSNRFEASKEEMIDEYRIVDYGIERHGRIEVETWKGWENFLKYCVKGYAKQVKDIMSADDIIKQYQAKVALFIAAHYGHADLANEMMKMGARPDRPVGEHPSRQWCISSLSNILKPFYSKCPIHEAIINGQLKLLTSVFGKKEKDEEWMLEEPWNGLPPWRLALRNTHKDPVKKMKQKEVAKLLLMRQFGLKKELSPKCSISIHSYYNIKNWAERARQRVLFKHGIHRTSYKKPPFHKGGLVGYKVLVDGYNNDFTSYPNAFEYMKNKYKHYYFVDDDEKKKHTNPETYFRTLNTVGVFNLLKPMAIAKFSKLIDANNEATKSKERAASSLNYITTKPAANKPVQSDRPVNMKARAQWRKAINAVINYLILNRNAEGLKAIGFDVEVPKFILEILKNKEKEKKEKSRRTNSKLEKKTSNKKPASLGILQLVKDQLEKEDGEEETQKPKPKPESKTPNVKKSSFLPNIDENRVKSISVNEMRAENLRKSKLSDHSKKSKESSSSPMSMTSLQFLPKLPNDKLNSESPTFSDENGGNPLAGAMRNLLAQANANSNTGLVKNKSQTKLHTSMSMNNPQNQTMKLYMKYCDGLTPRDIAKKCLDDANAFTGRSWLKQISIGAAMAQQQAKRRIEGLVE